MNLLFSRARNTFGFTSLALSVLIIGYLVFSPRKAFAAVLYWYKGGEDNNWTTLPDNWWTDEAHTQQAGSLPTGSDSVVLLGPVAPVADISYWTPPASIDSTGLTGEANESGPTFTNSYYYAYDMEVNVTGNATFDGSIGSYYLNNTATISGNAYFTNAYNVGTVEGNAFFFGIADNYGGVVEGNATFNDSSGGGGTIQGDATFNDSSHPRGTVNGVAKLNFSSNGVGTLNNQNINLTASSIVGSDDEPITSWIFNVYSSNSGTITGSAVFNYTSQNEGTIIGDVVFNDSSRIYGGTVNGNATFNDTSLNSGHTNNENPGGIVTGDAIFNDNSRNAHGYTYGTGGTVQGNATFNDSSANYYTDGYSYRLGTVSGNATFNGDLSENSIGDYSGTVSGTKTRRYTTDTTTTRDFTDSPWTVLAYNAAVNIAGATFDITTTFKTAYSGSFFPSVASSEEEQVPFPPTAVSATAGDAQAVVSFTAPDLDGDSDITSYTVTSSPGSITASGAASPITVTGLTNGTEYTFTVTATNVIGTSEASDASAGVTPVAAEAEPEEEEEEEAPRRRSSGGSSVSSRVSNLIAQGNIEAAQQLAQQYPNAVTPTVPGCPPGFSCTPIAPSTPTQPIPSPFTFTRNLTVGSSGTDVRHLQIFLNTHGYIVSTTGGGSPGNETTYFGEKTRQALARYQAAHNITPAVGYFGPVTRQKVGE